MTEARTSSVPDMDALTVAYVSGKGGVGKTMLALAAAKELAGANRTLIVDLDYFNRGATGLLRGGTRLVTQVAAPRFLQRSHAGRPDTMWSLVQGERNLFHVDYPDLTRDEMRVFQSMDPVAMAIDLQEFVARCAAAARCRCVVLDCHGGPDNASFVACLMAHYSLLVSEPDRVTLHGTLNFARQLEAEAGSRPYDLRLVLNRVPTSFSSRHLRQVYDDELRSFFGGADLLAVYPLESAIAKEFDRTPYLTAVYPNALLTRKTQALIYDLLVDSRPYVLPGVVTSGGGSARRRVRWSLGKQSPLTNTDLIMAVVMAGVVIAVVTSFIPWISSVVGGAVGGDLLTVLSLLGAWWFLAAVIARWTDILVDNRLSHASRRGNSGGVAMYATVFGVLWVVVLVAQRILLEAADVDYALRGYAGGVGWGTAADTQDTGIDEILGIAWLAAHPGQWWGFAADRPGPAMLGVIYVVTVGLGFRIATRHLYRAYRVARYEHYPVEASVLFLLAMLLVVGTPVVCVLRMGWL